jgi:transposase
MAERPHPEQGFRACMGLIGLGRRYSGERLEAACTRAVRLQAHSYQSVKSMLQKGLDRQALPELVALPAPVEHDNIRGAGYYADPQPALFGEVAG